VPNPLNPAVEKRVPASAVAVVEVSLGCTSADEMFTRKHRPRDCCWCALLCQGAVIGAHAATDRLLHGCVRAGCENVHVSSELCMPGT
jgi:hypothetical protein